MTSVIIPNSVTSIGGDAFEYCSGLTSVTIPSSVTTIGDYAFHLVNNIVYNGTATWKSYDMYWGAKCVNGYVDGYLIYSDASKTTLCGCSSAAMGEIIIPNSVTTIRGCAFANCYNLTSVTIGNSVTTIGDEAFAYCSDLTSVTIPNSVTTIEGMAFFCCTGLTSITIPNSVTTIGNYAFVYVNNIVYNGTATWRSDNRYWGAKCVNGYVDGYLVYSDASKTTLCGCSTAAIGEITIPNSVTTIGESVFYGCSSLTSVTIPSSVASIGNEAFAWCNGLTSVAVHWTDVNELPVIGSDAFRGIANEVGPSAATLHVPAGTKSIYENADQWKDFGTIVSDTPTPLPNALMHNSQPTMHKVLRNGQILLERNNATYTLMGQKVR